MENEKTEEVITSENDNEAVETPVETVEAGEETDNIPTVEDYEKLKQQNKELFERAKKAEAQAKEIKSLEAKSKPLNKTNETQPGLTREEAILYAKGYSDEEVALANKLAKLEGVSPLVAIEDEVFKAKLSAKRKKERSEKASLPASNTVGKITLPKPIGEMSKEEHAALYHKVMGNV